jgi:signal peptide peptidase SppA
MNHLTPLISWALATPWALQPGSMSAYAAVLARRFAQRQGVVADLGLAASAQTPAAAAPRASAGATGGGVAVIQVLGTIVQRASQLPLCEGGTTTDSVSLALRQANADETVGAIVLDIDSPGGSVYGVAELAAEIRGSAKPVTAVASSLAASAAYWMGCAASEFYVTPGGEVGSIGVWAAHQNVADALKAEGVEITLISAGKFKVEGNPYGPLDAEAAAFMQSRIDDYYAAFTRDVAKGRKVSVDDVRGGMGQGRVLGAQHALDQKMVDGVMTFDQVLARAQRNVRAARSANRATQQRATQLALLSLE